MAETTEKPLEKEVPRWVEGLRGALAVTLSLVLFVMVNYIASRHYRRWDWTHEGLFTLSERSKQIARGLHEPVDVYVLLSHSEPLYSDASELAERYAAASPRVRLHYLDPDAQRERFVALAQEVDVQIVESRQTDHVFSNAAIVVRRGSRHVEVSRESMRELGAAPEGESETDLTRRANTRITVERSISEALLQVDTDHATRLCFSTGHAEMPIAASEHASSGLAEDLRHHNFTVQEVEVHGQSGVPDNCDALVIAGAERTWSNEDASAVERYLRRGGNVAIFVDVVVLEGRVVPTGLEGVARLAGIDLPTALTVESDHTHLMPEVPPVHFRADNWNEHEITHNLRGTSIIASMVRPVRRAENSTVVPAAIVQTTPGAWGETAISELLRTFAPSHGAEDVSGPISIAMASEVPEVTRHTNGMPSGRIVVVGTSEIVGAEFFSLSARNQVSNANLAEAIVGWLTARRELVSIPARPVSRAALLVDEDHLSQIGLYVVLLIPLAAGLVGFAVSRARKAVS